MELTEQFEKAATNSKNLPEKPGIDRVFPLKELNTVPLPATIRNMLNNGYYRPRTVIPELIK